MARYDFKCEKCNKVEERSIPMDKYLELEKQQFCECGERMIRVMTEFTGNINLCKGMYGTDGIKSWNR